MYSKEPVFKNVFKFLFDFRYLITIIIILLSIGFGAYLYLYHHWYFKDAAQLSIGFLIAVSLFFTALNYEFAASKMKMDYKAAKELTTYNIATEWYKSPINEYQKTSIRFENTYIKTKSVRNAEDFNQFLNNPLNIEYKESLKGILNYFETVSIGCFKGLIDKDFIKDFHQSIYKIYYIDYFFYIETRRNELKNQNIFINFTNLVEEWDPHIREDVKNEVRKSAIIT